MMILQVYLYFIHIIRICLANWILLKTTSFLKFMKF